MTGRFRQFAARATIPTMADEQNDAAAPPGWLRVLTAPWAGIVRPAKDATVLAAAPQRRFWTMYFAHAAVLAAIVVLLAMVDATVHRTWIPPTTIPAGVAASNPSTLPFFFGRQEACERTIAVVWSDWHAPGPFGPAESIFVFVVFLICMGTAFLAWLNLPLIHRCGLVLQSASLSFRAVATAGGLLVALTIAIGVLILVANREDRLGSRGVPFELVMAVWMGTPVGVTFLLERIGRAVSAVAERPLPFDLPPTCESCGYDLSHQPDDARCPECGVRVGHSLSPDRRPGVDWERPGRSSFQTWVETSWSVVTEPRVFYTRLRLRTNFAAASAFLMRTHVCLGVVAGSLALVLSVCGEVWDDWWEPAALAVIVALCGSLGCWLGHRLGGAIVVTWWIFSRALPDVRWAAKALAYESAFLWVFCAFWGLFATSIVAGGAWLSEWLGKDFFYNVFWRMPAELVVFLGGTGLLALVWFWRYRIALRAIRWSNF